MPQELVNKTTAIRDLSTAAMDETGAAGRGVTAARVPTRRGVGPDYPNE